MKVMFAAAMLIVAGAVPASAQNMAAQGDAAQGDGVSLRTDKQIAAGLATLTDGSAAVPLPMGGTTVISVRRQKNGLPEAHAALDDVLVGQKGTPVTILVGGTLEGAKEISPGEPRGGRIVGGRRIAFGPGDVITLPAGVPHQMLVAKGEFRYLAFKMPKK